MKRLAVVALTVFFAACALLGPAERAQIAKDAAKIEECQELGRLCKMDGGSGKDCYAQYDQCMIDGGMR